MFFPIITTLIMLFSFLVYYLLGGYLNMNGTIIAALITGAVTIIGIFIGTIIVFLRGRHHEENEHDNLSKEHNGLSKEHDNLITLQKEHKVYLESLIKENRQELRHLSNESIRMESLRKEVEKQGVDVGRLFADIQSMTQMNGELSKKNTSLTEEIGALKKENYSLKEDREWMREQIQNLQEQLKEKEQTIRELQQPQRDEPDWDLGR